MKTAEVAIIGGGLAGSAAAITLAQAGRQVVLLEAERSPTHKVCGEFLSAEALEDLVALGVDVRALGPVGIRRVRFAQRGGQAATERALPFPAMSLTRRSLDAALLERARAAGAEVCTGQRVLGLKRAGKGWRVRTAAGDETLAGATVVASGKHDLTGRPRPAGVQRGLLAMKMYFRLAAAQTGALGDAVELLTYPGGYAGLQPVESGAANLCCLVQSEVFRQLGGRWEALLDHMQAGCPHLRVRLAGATALLDRPLAVASLPYGFVRRGADGLWYVGDQAVVIPSFTGDGMSLALHSGRRAALAMLRGESAGEFQAGLASDVSGQVRLATAISRAMVNRVSQPLLLRAVQAWPGSLQMAARWTRVPARARAACTAASPPRTLWRSERSQE